MGKASTKRPTRRSVPERARNRLKLATADLQKAASVKAPPAKRAGAQPKKPVGGGVGTRRHPLLLSPSVLAKRLQRTATALARVKHVLKNDVSDQEIGHADRAEVAERAARVLREVNIEQYDDSRLARTRGLPKSWIGEIWMAILLSLKWLRDELVSVAKAEVLELNGELTRGGAVRFNEHGLVDRIADLPSAERPGAFNGEIATLLNVRLLPRGLATTVDEARARTKAAKKYTDVIYACFQSVSRAPREATREWHENSWVGFGAGNEFKVPGKRGDIPEQSAEATPRFGDASHVVFTLGDVNHNPVLDRAGNPIEVVMPAERWVFNTDTATNRFGTTGSTAKEAGIMAGQKIEVDFDYQLGRARGFKAGVVLYRLAIPVSGADKILNAIFNRVVFKRGGKRKK